MIMVPSISKIQKLLFGTFQVHKVATTPDNPDPTGSVIGNALIGSSLMVEGILEIKARSDSGNDGMNVEVRIQSDPFEVK